MCFLTEDLAHLGWQLSRLALMVQAAVLDGGFFGFCLLSMIAVSRPGIVRLTDPEQKKP